MTALRHPVTGATVNEEGMSESRLAKLTKWGFLPITAGGDTPAKKPAKKAAVKKTAAKKR